MLSVNLSGSMTDGEDVLAVMCFVTDHALGTREPPS
jgi:hypothetical protein